MPESPVSSQEKWDRRFSEKNQLPPTARVLMDNRDLLPKQGRGLEVACGLGANSLFLAEQGLHIEAWDISTVALAKLTQRAQQLDLSICTRWIDVEIEQDLPRQHYDLIVVSHFYIDLCAHYSARPCDPMDSFFTKRSAAKKIERSEQLLSLILMETQLTHRAIHCTNCDQRN